MFRLPSSRLRPVCALLLAGALGLGPAAAAQARRPHVVSGGVYYVDGSSRGCSDAHTAAQAQSDLTPWCSISQAAAAVPADSTILVEPGTYHEDVVLTATDDGVTLENASSKRPVITGDGVRRVGIVLTGGVHNVTISGFEISDMHSSASADADGIVGFDTHDDTISDNVIHAIHGDGLWAYGIELGNNNQPGLVHDVTISNNRIYDIGPGGESMGIWLLYARHMTISRNEIYLVRKEGIRDWFGIDNSIVGNRTYLNWAGICLEAATGDYVANNLMYANVWGFEPKHVSESGVDSTWGLSQPRWTQFWHNTSVDETHADVALGMNSPSEDYLDLRDNVFADPGDVHLHDFPQLRGSHVVVNSNLYTGSAPVYYAGWNVPYRPLYASLGALHAGLGWEPNGISRPVHFGAPSRGDFSLAASMRDSGMRLSDAYGSQLGAVNPAPASMSWTRYPATVVQTTPEPSFLKPGGASDGTDDRYWWSTNYNTDGMITFDLGQAERINTFVMDLFSMDDPRTPRQYEIQVSNDDSGFHTVLAGTNQDNEGSSYKYMLQRPVTARYVRLKLLNGFGGSTLLFSDFGIGLLSSQSASQSLAAHAHVRHRHGRRHHVRPHRHHHARSQRHHSRSSRHHRRRR
jgi:hypothetical protein